MLLVEMSAAEFARRRAELWRDIADSLVVARRLAVPEAEALAESSIAASLPVGPATPGQIVRSALVEGTTIGWIWIAMPGKVMPEMAWINDIVVDPPYRRRGYAGAIIAAAETQLAASGVGHIGLNVYSHNDTARRLYQRLGFQSFRQVRSRSLTDLPGSRAAGLTLAPITPAALSRRLDGASASSRSHMPTQPHPDEYFIRTATAGDTEVGWIYYGVHGPGRPGMGWIYQVDVDEPYRSRGYGTSIITSALADLVRRGARSAGLFVRGDNVDAQRLYDRLGFDLIAQDMAKPVAP